jgi:hypothetical protein
MLAFPGSRRLKTRGCRGSSLGARHDGASVGGGPRRTNTMLRHGHTDGGDAVNGPRVGLEVERART